MPASHPRALTGPGVQTTLRAPSRQRIQSRLMSPHIEQLGAGLLLRATHRHRLATHHLSHRRRRIVHIPHQDRLRRAHHHTGRLQPNIQPMSTEIALLRRMILRVDENGVIRTSRHARLAPDADPLVEIHDPVRTSEHRPGRTRRHTRSVLTLITAGHLKRPPRLRKHPHIHRLHISPGHPQRHLVLRLTRRRARMTTNTHRLVDHLHPTGGRSLPGRRISR